MTLTADDVINRMRDKHPSLSPQNAPQPVALRELTALVQGLYSDIFPRVPGLLAQTVAITLLGVAFDRITEDGYVRVVESAPDSTTNGIDLTTVIPDGWLDLLMGEFLYDTTNSTRGPVQATFVPFEQVNHPSQLPAFTLLGNTLFFVGQASIYGNFVQFNVTYTGLPADLSAPTSTVSLPGDAREPLASMLAAALLGRLIGNPQWEVTADVVGRFEARAAGQRAAFLKRIYRTTQRQIYHMRDVRPDPGGPWFP